MDDLKVSIEGISIEALDAENRKAHQEQLKQINPGPVTEKTWEDFRNNGLLLFINQILHIFGWAIVFEMDDVVERKVTRVYPARVKFRGFDGKTVSRAYKRLGKYLAENSKELYEEVEYEEDN